jgi:hypothetical protein
MLTAKPDSDLTFLIIERHHVMLGRHVLLVHHQVLVLRVGEHAVGLQGHGLLITENFLRHFMNAVTILCALMVEHSLTKACMLHLRRLFEIWILPRMPLTGITLIPLFVFDQLFESLKNCWCDISLQSIQSNKVLDKDVEVVAFLNDNLSSSVGTNDHREVANNLLFSFQSFLLPSNVCVHLDLVPSSLLESLFSFKLRHLKFNFCDLGLELLHFRRHLIDFGVDLDFYDLG